MSLASLAVSRLGSSFWGELRSVVVRAAGRAEEPADVESGFRALEGDPGSSERLDALIEAIECLRVCNSGFNEGTGAGCHGVVEEPVTPRRGFCAHEGVQQVNINCTVHNRYPPESAHADG